MACMALVCPLSSAQIAWQGLDDHNPITNTDGQPIEAYGVFGLSSYVNPYYTYYSRVSYFDWEPPTGYPGFSSRAILSLYRNNVPAHFDGDTRNAAGLVTVSHISRLTNSEDTRVVYLYCEIEHPDELRILLGWYAAPDCASNTAAEAFQFPSNLLYTAPAGYVISTVSTTSSNDMKYVAISLKSGDNKPGPTILMESKDMVTFTNIGQITDEKNTPITVWKTFTIFSALNLDKPSEEALYIYHVESATSKSYLRYASITNVPIGRFQDVSNQFGFNDNDIALINQNGTASAVSINGEKVLLVRLGQDISTTDGTQTLVEKMFFPGLVTASPEVETKVTDKDGTVRSVDASCMPAITSTRCDLGSSYPGQALPGWQVGLTWIDRQSKMHMEGFANIF